MFQSSPEGKPSGLVLFIGLCYTFAIILQRRWGLGDAKRWYHCKGDK